LPREALISCSYSYTGKLWLTIDPKTKVNMPCIRLDDSYFEGHKVIDPKKQFLGLRTGDRILFEENNELVSCIRSGEVIPYDEFNFNELMARCRRGMTYLRHTMSFVPILDDTKLRLFLDALERKEDCILIRFVSL